MAVRFYRQEAGQVVNSFQKPAVMKAAYQFADRKDSPAPAQSLSGEGQALLPMVEVIEQAEMAVDELIDVAAGRRSRPS